MKNLDRHGEKWRVRWTNACDQRKSKMFSEKKDARLFLVTKLKELEGIKRELSLGYEVDKNCSDIFDYYLQNHRVNKRSPKDSQNIISKYFKPFFSKILLKDTHFPIERFKSYQIENRVCFI